MSESDDRALDALALLRSDSVVRMDPSAVRTYTVYDLDGERLHIVSTGETFATRCDCGVSVCEHILAVVMYEQEQENREARQEGDD